MTFQRFSFEYQSKKKRAKHSHKLKNQTTGLSVLKIHGLGQSSDIYFHTVEKKDHTGLPAMATVP